MCVLFCYLLSTSSTFTKEALREKRAVSKGESAQNFTNSVSLFWSVFFTIQDCHLQCLIWISFMQWVGSSQQSLTTRDPQHLFWQQQGIKRMNKSGKQNQPGQWTLCKTKQAPKLRHKVCGKTLYPKSCQIQATKLTKYSPNLAKSMNTFRKQNKSGHCTEPTKQTKQIQGYGCSSCTTV